MITSGHFIGQIIDELSQIAREVEIRNRIGLTDLNRYLENFFKEILNVVLDLKLENLNSERSNCPGIDLGDRAKSIAFQVTSTKTSQKVNDTLRALDDDAISNYQCILILIVGEKQGSYTIDETLKPHCTFDASHIWDIVDVCKKLMDLKLDRLQQLHNYVRAEVARVRIELEIPNSDGTYPTSIANFIESIPTIQIGPCDTFCRVMSEIHPTFEHDTNEVSHALTVFSDCLKSLPRVTREFYAFLLEHRDRLERLDGSLSFNLDRLVRVCKWPDLTGELRLLASEGLITVNEEKTETSGGYVKLHVPSAWPRRHQKRISNRTQLKYDFFENDLVEFIEHQQLSYKELIVGIDFSAF